MYVVLLVSVRLVPSTIRCIVFAGLSLDHVFAFGQDRRLEFTFTCQTAYTRGFGQTTECFVSDGRPVVSHKPVYGEQDGEGVSDGCGGCIPSLCDAYMSTTRSRDTRGRCLV